MSALSPAPAPASGVRWTDLSSPLDSALPSCYLSYKQSAFSSPLCFHTVTNCFFRKPFVLRTICVAPWCAPRSLCFDLRALCVVLFPAVDRPVFSATCSLLLENTRRWGRGLTFSRHSPLPT